MMDAENKKNIAESKVVLINKKELCLTGVSEFISATESCVVLNINGEEFVVEGKNLTVTNLDTTRGVLELNGEVLALSFQNTKNNKFSLKNLFNR